MRVGCKTPTDTRSGSSPADYSNGGHNDSDCTARDRLGKRHSQVHTANIRLSCLAAPLLLLAFGRRVGAKLFAISAISAVMTARGGGTSSNSAAMLSIYDVRALVFSRGGSHVRRGSTSPPRDK